MPQHQGGQVTTLGPTPVQTNPGPEASANIIRACTSKRDACETHRERGYDNSLLWSHFLCPQESKFQKQTKSLLNRTSSLPLNSLPGRGRGWKGVEGRMYPNECIVWFQVKMTPLFEIPSSPTSEPESVWTPLLPLLPFDDRISSCSDDSLEPADFYTKEWVGKKQNQRISRFLLVKFGKADWRDYQPLDLGTFLTPLRNIDSYLEEESSQVPHQQEVHNQIGSTSVNSRNGPDHPAMMHDRRERAQNGVSLLGGPEKFFFHTFSRLPFFECTGNFL